MGVPLSYELATAYVNVVASTNGVGRQLQRDFGGAADAAGDSAGRSSGKRFGGAFVGVVKKAGAIGAAVAVGLAAKGGISRALNIEDAQAKLAGLGHSTESVQKIMDNAMASVKGTAFGMGDAATVAAGVVAAGVKPGQDLERTLKLVGDSATIAGTGMGEMGAIFNKVASSNKIQGDVIAQLNDAGIPIVQLLGKELGKTAEEVTSMASAGEIGFETFQNAMEKGLGGAAQKSGETFRGSLANVKAALGRVGETLLSPFLAGVKTGMNKLIPIIDGVNAFLKPIMAKVGPMMAAVGAQIGPVFTQIWQGIQPFIQSLQTAFGPAIQAVSNAFAPLIPQLGQIFQGFSPLSLLMQAITPILPVLAQAFQSVGTALAQVVPPLAEMARNLMGSLVPVVTQVIQSLLPPLIKLFTNLAPVIADIVTALGPLVSAVLSVLIPAIEALLPVVQTVFESLEPIIKAALEIVQGVIQTVTALIKGDWKGVWDGIMKILSGVWNLIKSVVEGAIKYVQSLIQNVGSKIVGIWNDIWGKIGRFLSEAWANIKKGVSDGIGAVVTFFSGLWGKITGAVGDLLAKGASIGADIMRGIANGIGSGVQWVKDRIGDGINGVIGWAKGLLGIHSPSRVFRDQIGKQISRGMAVGITAERKKVTSAVESVIKATTKTSEDAIKKETKRLQEARRKQNAQIAAANKKLGKRVANLGTLSSYEATQKAQAKLGKKASKKAVAAEAKRLQQERRDLLKRMKNGKLESLGSLSKADAEKQAKKNLAAQLNAAKKAQALVKAQGSQSQFWGKMASTDILINSLNSKGSWTKNGKVLNSFQAATLTDFAKAREKVASRLKVANEKLDAMIDYRNQYRDQIKGELDLRAGIGQDSTDQWGYTTKGKTTFESVAGQVKALAAKAKTFAGKLKSLLKIGIPKGLVTEIAGYGTEEGIKVADALLSMPAKGSQSSAIADLASSYSSLNSWSTEVGNQAVVAGYGIGINTQQGIIKGLEADDAKLEKAAKKLADKLAKQVKKALGIHSPSRVFRDQIGRFLPLGIVAGIDAEQSTLDDRVAGMVSANRPAVASGLGVSYDGPDGQRRNFSDADLVALAEIMGASMEKRPNVTAFGDRDVLRLKQMMGRVAPRLS